MFEGSNDVTENPYPEDSPLHHTTNVKGWLRELIEHLREDIGKVDDPKAEALSRHRQRYSVAW